MGPDLNFYCAADFSDPDLLYFMRKFFDHFWQFLCAKNNKNLKNLAGSFTVLNTTRKY